MRYYMLNKPSGVVTATADRSLGTVMDCFPPEIRNGLHPAGRLDRDTEGLLIITDDGDFTFRLIRPEFETEKRYFFRAFGSLDEEKIAALKKGGFLFGNGEKARPAEISETNQSSVLENAAFIPEKKRKRALRNPKGPAVSGVITVTEGKRHEVKLLLRSVGCSVFYLKRLSMGEIVLDESLAPGEFREFTLAEREFAERLRKVFIKL